MPLQPGRSIMKLAWLISKLHLLTYERHLQREYIDVQLFDSESLSFRWFQTLAEMPVFSIPPHQAPTHS